jgi:dienelactone hydrolase
MQTGSLSPGAIVALVSLLLPIAVRAEPLPGTRPLEMQGDLASQMVAGIDRFLLKEIDQSIGRRAALWKRDTSSPARYEASVTSNRKRLRRYIGVMDPRIGPSFFELVADTGSFTSEIGRGDGYAIHAVRWPVLPGVEAEGLLLVPIGHPPAADCIALPDADQTPEMLVGLAAGVPAESQFARRLAENGCRVVVPLLIDRRDTYSALANRPPTNQPHREWIYRQAFEMGRHIIGYEVQKVLGAVDRLSSGNPGRKIGVFGYGEGGLLALYTAALDRRIQATCTSGYFDSRQDLWQEPIYRNVFGLLSEFGDAELASLVAPGTLIVEACRVPHVTGPPPAGSGHTGGAAPGRLLTPSRAVVEQELARARGLVSGLQPAPVFELIASEQGQGPFGSEPALTAFLKALGCKELRPAGKQPVSTGKAPDPAMRFKRQFDQLVDFTQYLVREAEYTRRAFWAKADRQARSVEKWQQTTAWYGDYFATEVIGRFDYPFLSANARTRKIYDEPRFTGYEVVLDVFPDVFAYGILLVPRDIKDGERRPVVVCQHGLEGRPQDVADPHREVAAYHQFACRLAERGFITYAPQNPYIFEDRFRTLQRKANPLKKTLFSIIVPQHLQTVDWLASLPMVDPERIAFYGLSYGGKTAMRVPALVSRYCLSICSADFNEWIWKNAQVRSPYSYVGTGEYEIFEFDLGNTFNYAEIAGLIAPRPFMVERGHHDGVAPDEWVAYEYAKVRKLYADLKIPDRTTIEFFDGPHSIHGAGTFAFLHRQLGWPAPR